MAGEQGGGGVFSGSGPGGVPIGASAGPDNAIARWDGVTAIQGSNVLLNDSNNLQFPNDTGIYFRNAANTAWLNWTWNDGANNISVGTTGGGANPGLYLAAVNNVTLSTNAGNVLDARITGCTVTAPVLVPNAGGSHYLGFGSTLPSTGEIRCQAGMADWYGRTAAVDVHIASLDSGNNHTFGDWTYGNATSIRVKSTSTIGCYVGAAALKFDVSATEIRAFAARLELSNATYLAHGAAAEAGQGNERFRQDGSLCWRNFANTGDISGLWMSATNNDLNIGGNFGTAARPTNIILNADTQNRLSVGGTAQVDIDANGLECLRGLALSAVDYTTADSPVTIPQGVIRVGLDTTGGAIAATLPSAATNPGQTLVVKDIASNCTTTGATVASAAGDTIDNVDRSTGTGVPYPIATDDQALWLRSDGGSNWEIL